MKEDIKKLENEFQRIKSMGFIKSMRNGSTGLGYTFETLLNKKEDQECKPDYGSIEIKCKFNHSKINLTLFNCAPKRHSSFATRYIFENYGYYKCNNQNSPKIFSESFYSNNSKNRNGYSFKLKVDYYKTQIDLLCYYNGKFKEIVCNWDFKILENKLKKKLSFLALVYAYKYKKDGIMYYKYSNLYFYKLKGFFEFLELINNDMIYITVYIKDGFNELGNSVLDTHGFSFKIKKDGFKKLFYKINK